MADINPPSFGGTTAEDAESWLRHFSNYCDFKSHLSAKILALFKVLMTGSAATWLDSLSDDIKNDWGVMRDCFLTRYTTPEFLNYKNAHELFNSKQGIKSVNDFYANMQRIAKRVGADDTMLRFAVLNGLRPEIANFVTQKQPSDLENLLETARLGEMCVINQPNTDTVVIKQLAQMQDQLRQLSIKFDTPTAAPISDVTRGRVSPRRVHFDEENDRRSRSYDRRSNYDNRRSFNRSNSPVTRQRGFGRGISSSYRSFQC